MGEQDARFRDGPDRLARRARIAQPSAADAAFLELLDAEIGPPNGPPLRPRAAAALILLDRAGDPPRILMGRRNPNLAFMGDKYVFPGGRVDACDRRMSALTNLSGATAERLAARRARGRPGAPRALALAAIRETFEETGYLVGARERGEIPAPAGAWSDFAAQGVSPRLDGLYFIARAVTPPGRVRRFDTAFLCADAGQIAGRTDKILGPNDELVEISWIPLTEIGTYPLAAITRVVLRDLCNRLDQGLDAAAPAPFYRQIRGRWRREQI